MDIFKLKMNSPDTFPILKKVPTFTHSGWWCVVILDENISKWVSVYDLINTGALSSGQVFIKMLYNLLTSKLLYLQSPNYG